MTLQARAISVSTREELARFIEDLAKDCRSHLDEWENGDLLSFLGAMAGWIQDMDEYYRRTGQRIEDLSAWRMLAEALLAARSYE